MNTPSDTLECGHSLSELSAYLDTGIIDDPRHLETCPECQAGLASLQRLSELGNDLLQSDVADAGSGNDDWMQSILDNLRLELRPGRNIPLHSDHPDDALWETEGAVSALIRTVADSFPGTAAGKCRLHGDVTTAGAGITVEVELAVVYGHSMDERASALRQELAEALAFHTELNVQAIDITVTDVLEPTLDPTTPTTPEEQP